MSSAISGSLQGVVGTVTSLFLVQECKDRTEVLWDQIWAVVGFYEKTDGQCCFLAKQSISFWNTLAINSRQFLLLYLHIEEMYLVAKRY